MFTPRISNCLFHISITIVFEKMAEESRNFLLVPGNLIVLRNSIENFPKQKADCS